MIGIASKGRRYSRIPAGKGGSPPHLGSDGVGSRGFSQSQLGSKIQKGRPKVAEGATAIVQSADGKPFISLLRRNGRNLVRSFMSPEEPILQGFSKFEKGQYDFYALETKEKIETDPRGRNDIGRKQAGRLFKRGARKGENDSHPQKAE